MLKIQSGSHALNIVTILSVAGEFSPASVYLLGSEKVIKALIANMCIRQEIILGDKSYMGRLLTVSGHGKFKSVRLTKWARPVLKAIGADEYYMGNFGKRRFTGNLNSKDRNYRVAECLMMFFMSGFEFRPSMLPNLGMTDFRKAIPKEPVFYLGKDLKKLVMEEMPKTQFTRVTGMMFCNREPYAIYNTRNSVMKWNGGGECKTVQDLSDIARMNAESNDVKSAIVFYKTDKTAIETVRDIRDWAKADLGFMQIYDHIHFIPLSADGISQLRLFAIPKWRNAILECFFDDEERSYDIGEFEYDAMQDGNYIFSFLDGDVARLIRFKRSITEKQFPFGIVCFPHQENIVKEFLGAHIEPTVVALGALEKALGIKEDT